MRFKKTDPTVPDIDMTPMIDVTFQLITFFMVITNFENTRADERVKLPKDELARPSETTRDNEVVLNMGFIRNAEGENVAGPFVFYGDGENYPVLEVGTILKREYRYFKDVGKKPEDATIVLRSDGEVPTGLVQEAIKLAQEAGFSKFALKAMSEEK
ncbi:MAG: biopolymer transporter ExbD [Planctomycetota bacterium]|nr:biopolymer transporter ExbD [Planctomycetaceae bacterium]MDQ3332611.1 biopolymer transporter ExbD [Planctomycetota bacterium]